MSRSDAFAGGRSGDGRQVDGPAQRHALRKMFWFSAALTIAFFVTIEMPVRPQAGIHADFQPATQMDMLRANLPVPKRPAEDVRVL